jgi:DNA modification methylase
LSKPAHNTPSNDLFTVHIADARATESFLAHAAVSLGTGDKPFIATTITSPPYANLVDYGVGDQIGFGQSYDIYLHECEQIFKSVHKWTREDGTLWVVADSLIAPALDGQLGSLTPLPFDLARVATTAGWTLREVIIWRKDRTRPWASPGRLRNGFEYILMFARSPGYKFEVDRVRDYRDLKSWWIKYPERHNPWGKTPDNVWDIPIPLQGSWASDDLRHACPFPVELVRRILDLSTDIDDIVFDPFAGSGMVPAVAASEGRRGFGTELNPEFVDAFRTTVRRDVEQARQDEHSEDNVVSAMTENLLKLRVLKYAKELVKAVLRSGVDRAAIVGAIVRAEALDLEPHAPPYAVASISVVLANARGAARVEQAISDATRHPPLSKFSLDVKTSVETLAELPSEGTLSVYRQGRTWRAAASAQALTEYSEDEFPPIAANLSVNVYLEE